MPPSRSFTSSGSPLGAPGGAVGRRVHNSSPTPTIATRTAIKATTMALRMLSGTRSLPSSIRGPRGPAEIGGNRQVVRGAAGDHLEPLAAQLGRMQDVIDAMARPIRGERR